MTDCPRAGKLFDPQDRFDTRGYCGTFDRIKFMSRASGYVMVRKPHCMPFVMSEKQWADLPAYEEGKRLSDMYRAGVRA